MPTPSPSYDYLYDLDDTNAPAPNVPLMHKVYDHIQAHPEEWRQDYFAIDTISLVDAEIITQKQADRNLCGTAFCVAGHAANMVYGMKRISGYTDPFPDHPSRNWAHAGQEALGLTYQERTDLFRAGNSLPEIKAIMTRIAARAGEEF